VKIRLLFLFVLLQSYPASLLAQGSGFSGNDLNPRTLGIQSKAESLYQRGSWERAHLIYVNELAPIGDKYAQYMAGYMCQWGHGVEKDPVMASAWYRVAAERDSPEFVALRDEMLKSLSPEERERSDIEYVALRQKFSDLVVAMTLLFEEFNELENGGTGSRLSGRGGSLTIVDAQSGRGMSKDAMDKRVLDRMQPRLDFITEKLEIEHVEAEDIDKNDLDALREQVREYLSMVDDR
jgi:hypothetical protein